MRILFGAPLGVARPSLQFMPLLLSILLLAPASLVAQWQDIEPMGSWHDLKQVNYRGKPILVHLRTGYERALLLPEPVRLADPAQQLPGCEVKVDQDVVGFYPSESFDRRIIGFVGLNSGSTYEFKVRATPLGKRQPMQVNVAR